METRLQLYLVKESLKTENTVFELHTVNKYTGNTISKEITTVPTNKVKSETKKCIFELWNGFSSRLVSLMETTVSFYVTEENSITEIEQIGNSMDAISNFEEGIRSNSTLIENMVANCDCLNYCKVCPMKCKVHVPIAIARAKQIYQGSYLGVEYHEGYAIVPGCSIIDLAIILEKQTEQSEESMHENKIADENIEESQLRIENSEPIEEIHAEQPTTERIYALQTVSECQQYGNWNECESCGQCKDENEGIFLYAEKSDKICRIGKQIMFTSEMAEARKKTDFIVKLGKIIDQYELSGRMFFWNPTMTADEKTAFKTEYDMMEAFKVVILTYTPKTHKPRLHSYICTVGVSIAFLEHNINPARLVMVNGKTTTIKSVKTLFKKLKEDAQFSFEELN